MNQQQIMMLVAGIVVVFVVGALVYRYMNRTIPVEKSTKGHESDSKNESNHEAVQEDFYQVSNANVPSGFDESPAIGRRGFVSPYLPKPQRH